MGSRIQRHYLFGLTDGGGTVPPEAAVVRRLVERGHRVRVLAEESMAADVLATGAEHLMPRRGAGNASGTSTSVGTSTAVGTGAAAAPRHAEYRDWERAPRSTSPEGWRTT